MQFLKLAKDLVPGDYVQTMLKTHVVMTAKVVAIVPSVMTVRRRVVLITLRDESGHEIHRTCNENTTIKLVSEGEEH